MGVMRRVDESDGDTRGSEEVRERGEGVHMAVCRHSQKDYMRHRGCTHFSAKGSAGSVDSSDSV